MSIVRTPFNGYMQQVMGYLISLGNFFSDFHRQWKLDLLTDPALPLVWTVTGLLDVQWCEDFLTKTFLNNTKLQTNLHWHICWPEPFAGNETEFSIITTILYGHV